MEYFPIFTDLKSKIVLVIGHYRVLEFKIDKLIDFIKTEKIKEVILATDSDEEGDATALYLARVIKPLGVKLTRIAFGIPVGSNIEYADQATLMKAFEGRRQF